jgi:preprotein translocase subunit SecD
MLLTARLVGVAAVMLGMVSLAPAAESPPKLELRRAETKPAEGLTEAKVAGSDEKVYLHKEAELTEKDVSKAQAIEDKKAGFAIEIVLTKEGQKKLAKLTEEHVNKPLAILVDGKVIAAPIVRDKLEGGKAVITGNFTKAEAEKIAKGIKDK